jgi:hypothetical protein
VVECFPNTLLKLLPNTITKIKWSKKPAEIETWEDWWDIHQKILTPLKAQVLYIWLFLKEPCPENHRTDRHPPV